MEKEQKQFTVLGYFPYYDYDISEVFIEPYPKGLKPDNLLYIQDKVFLVTECNEDRDEVVIRGCKHIPQYSPGCTYVMVEKLSWWQIIKKAVKGDS